VYQTPDVGIQLAAMALGAYDYLRTFKRTSDDEEVRLLAATN
jgi:hypothetical protein